MRTATIVLAAVALMGGAHGAAVPRSEDTTTTTDVFTTTEEVVTTTEEIVFTTTETLIETATPISTETSTATETESATETATETESATEVSFLTEKVLGLVDCVRGVGKTCSDCISMDGFVPNLNGTCLMGCVTADENQAAFNDVCGPLGIDFAQFATCHDTLKETCGKCMEVEGEVFGLHQLDVDDDCFETCYWANKDAIRAACPLPEPLKKAYECHKQLAETCGDCVDDDHDIDSKCLDQCYANNQADLQEVCPEGVMKLFGEVAELEDDDDALKSLIDNVLGALGVPTEMLALLPFDVEDFIDDVMDGDVDLQELFQTVTSEDGKPDLQALINAIVATQEDDDDDEDDSSTAAAAMATETATPDDEDDDHMHNDGHHGNDGHMHNDGHHDDDGHMHNDGHHGNGHHDDDDDDATETDAPTATA